MRKIFGLIVLFAVLFGMATHPVSAGKKDRPVAAKDRGAMKGAGQVAVVAFNVGFIFESIDQTAKTGGLMGAFGGTTKAQSALVSVTPEMMQAITDSAYADFVSKLKASGVTVAAPETVFAHADMANVKGDRGPIEHKIQLEKKSNGKAVFYSPSGFPVQIVLPGDFKTSKGFASFGNDMRSGRNAGMIGAFAKNSGMPALDVVYLIDFSDQKRPGAFSFGGSLKVNANLSVVPDFSKVTVIGANGKKNELVLAQPVSVDGEFIEVADASTGREKAVQSAANVAGGLAAAVGIGLPKFGKTRKFEFNANHDNYQAGAIALAHAANDVTVSHLSAQR
ncbi:MAG: hypothetical protein DI637_00250 [Citromicrobium sp.]|nr:MAG: hypothetical protein DI637_00250 [Citromicrobium sp.]